MKTTYVRLVCASALALLSACAAPGAANESAAADTSGRDCFFASTINGYNNVDDDTIRVNTGPSRSYELDLVGPQCHQVQWTETLAIEAHPSPSICVGDGPSQGNIAFRDTATHQTVSCMIGAVRRVQEEAPPVGS